MLRITTIDCGPATTIFKLEGKLLGPWISELESACSASQVSPDRVHLDLQGLTFVDAEGARFLESLIRDGARVIACSGFVAEILRLEEP
jgi:anti-anti-sigma regulatory factor